MVTAVTPVGADYTSVDSSLKFALGTKSRATDGSIWTYVQVASTVTGIEAKRSAFISKDWTAIPTVGGATVRGLDKVPAVNAGSGVTLTASQYAWLQTEGPVSMVVAQDCAQGVTLYTTNTSGVLDDAIATGSQYPVRGVVVASVNASAVASAAAAVDCNMVNPLIGPMASLV